MSATELMDHSFSVREPGNKPDPDAVREFLATTDPFRRLSSQDLAATADVARVESFSAGTHVYAEGESVCHLWILMAGRVEVLKYAADGRSRGIETIFPGELFGSIYDNVQDQRSHSDSAVASVDSLIVRVPFPTFIYLTHRSLGFVSGLCTLYSRRIGEIEARVSGSNDPVEKRLARTLVELSDRLGKRIRITRREIAELAGTTVETSIRTLKSFERKHWISSGRGEITLRSLSDLRSLGE